MRFLLALLGATLLTACTEPCNRRNCDGCCDVSGECLSGTSKLACGEIGQACVRCAQGQLCKKAQCVAGPDAGVMDAGMAVILDGGVNLHCVCPNGCCTLAGACIGGGTQPPHQCGRDGGLCTECEPNSTCVAGRCQPLSCTGCVSPAGTCMQGNTVDACGPAGSVCFTCATGQLCINRTCALPCSVMTCALGCCNGGICLPLAQQTSQLCGLNSRNCVACDGGTTCDGGVCG